MTKYVKNKASKRIFKNTPPWAKILLLIVLIIFVGAVVYLLLSSRDNKTLNNPKDSIGTQNDYQDKSSHQPKETKNEGIVEDTGGNVDNTPPESAWTKSSDGMITVYLPPSNSVVKSGDTISGASTFSQVSYRIIDSVSGVIGQGPLSVVDGRFSGKISFTTNATQGRIDIFGVSPDGTEKSNVEINVRFK